MSRIIVVLVLGVCSVSFAGRRTMRSVFGEPHFKVLSQTERNLDPIASRMGAIFQVVPTEPSEPPLFIPFCSAFKLSNTMILTSAHCYRPAGTVFFENYVRREDAPEQLKVLGIGNVVRLMYDAENSTLPDHTSNVQAITSVVDSDEDLDIALLAIEPEANARKSIGPSLQSPDIQVGQAARLYHFPNGAPLTRSTQCTIQAVDGLRVYHDCDSATGSSGGLLVDAYSLQPLAVHVKGPISNSYNYYLEHGRFEDVTTVERCDANGVCQTVVVANTAVRIDAL